MQWLRESRGVDTDEFVMLFHCPEYEFLADQICELYPKHVKKGVISWGKFEDGFPNLFIKNVESVRGRDVAFLASFLNHAQLLAQLSVLLTIPRYLCRSLIIVLPYFPTGTMERVDEEGQIATAMTFARLLSAVPVSVGGPAKLIIYDIHALQNRFYFSDSVIPLLVSAVPLFVDVLKKKHKDEKVVIAYPDEGASKRFGNKFSEFPNVICTKVRQGAKRIVTLKEGEEYVKDAHVFIVDDLVKTGGTLIECKAVLLKYGAKQVSAYVTHAVFPQQSWKRFTEEKPDQFALFYTTDSCPESVKEIEGKKPFRIIPLASHIGENMLSY